MPDSLIVEWFRTHPRLTGVLLTLCLLLSQALPVIAGSGNNSGP